MGQATSIFCLLQTHTHQPYSCLMSDDDNNIHSAKQLAEQQPKKSKARKIADLAGKVSSASQLARLAEVLDGETTANAEEVARLVDETMPNEPVGIALALEYKIREKQAQVDQYGSQLSSEREQLRMVTLVDREHYEDYSADRLKVANDINEAHMALAEIIPFSVFPEDGILLHSAIIGTPDDPQDLPRDYRSETGLDLGGTNPTLTIGEGIFDPDAANAFIDALDGLSWKESCELRDAIRKLKTLTIHRNQIEKFFEIHQAAHPAIITDQEKRVAKAQEKYDTAVGELHVLVSCRAADTGVAQPIGISSTTDVSANVVGVSGTASIGMVKAAATASIEKSMEISAAFSQSMESEKVRWAAQEDETSGNKKVVDEIAQMVAAVRVRWNQPVQDVIDWRDTIKRSRSGTAAIHLATNTLNEAMPGLINTVYRWGFIDTHGREMLALRKGKMLPHGPLNCRVTDRFDPEGNNLICFLPDFGVFALVTVEVKTHGEFKIKTIMNDEEKDWTYYEENTPGVPANVKNIKGQDLSQLVAYHKLIMAHIDEKNPLKDIS